MSSNQNIKISYEAKLYFEKENNFFNLQFANTNALRNSLAPLNILPNFVLHVESMVDDYFEQNFMLGNVEGRNRMLSIL